MVSLSIPVKAIKSYLRWLMLGDGQVVASLLVYPSSYPDYYCYKPIVCPFPDGAFLLPISIPELKSIIEHFKDHWQEALFPN